VASKEGAAQEHVRTEPAYRGGLGAGGFLRLCPLVNLNVTGASLADNGLFSLARTVLLAAGEESNKLLTANP